MTNTIKKYLDNNQYSYLKNEFEDTLSSHPNNPSLYAITDTFTLFGIENVAAKISNEQFEELPDQFLSYVTEDLGKLDLVLVTKKGENVVIQTESKTKTIPNIQFMSTWNNIIIAIEANQQKQKNEKPMFNNKTAIYFVGLVVVVCLKLFLSAFDSEVLFYTIFSIIGLLISVFVLQEKWGQENQTISKLCSFDESISCDSVIQSKEAKINSWLSISDLPILFFGVNLFSLLIDSHTKNVVGMVNFLVLPAVFYSFWLQKVKLKKWCVLCLLIASIIGVQSVFWFFSENYFSLKNLGLISYVTVFSIIGMIWFAVKPIIERKVTLEKESIEHKKFKRNFSIFKSLSEEIYNPYGFENLTPIQIGSKNASTQLSLFLSPSCGHCHRAYQDAIEVASQFKDNIKVNVFFNINPNNEDNLYLVIVKNLLQINKLKPHLVQKALSDWHIEKMSIEDWMLEWEQIYIDEDVLLEIKEQYDWCSENEFNYTPVKLINTSLYPKEYDLKEVKYFITEFENSIVEV